MARGILWIALTVCALLLAGCSVTPHHIIVKDNLSTEDFKDESIVGWNPRCPHCSGQFAVAGAVPIPIYQDGRNRQIDFWRGTKEKCSHDFDDDILVWYKKGKPYQKMKIICNDSRRGYRAFIFDKNDNEKEISVVEDSLKQYTWIINLGEDFQKEYSGYEDKVSLSVDVPDDVSYESFQVGIYRNDSIGIRMVPYEFTLRTCKSCTKKRWVNISFAVSTRANEIVLYKSGVPFLSMSVNYETDGDKVENVKVFVVDGKEVPLYTKGVHEVLTRWSFHYPVE